MEGSVAANDGGSLPGEHRVSANSVPLAAVGEAATGKALDSGDFEGHSITGHSIEGLAPEHADEMTYVGAAAQDVDEAVYDQVDENAISPADDALDMVAPQAVASETIAEWGGDVPLPDLSDRTERDEAQPVPDVVAGWISLTSPHVLPLAVAPVVLVALAAWVEGARISIGLVAFLVVGILCVRAGASILASVRDATLSLLRVDVAFPRAVEETSLLLRAGISPRLATRIGFALVAVGCFLGLPVAVAGRHLVWAIGLAGVALVLGYLSVPSLVRVAAVAEVLAACALGPALGVITALSQHAPMTPLLWALSVALGLFALAVFLGSDLRDFAGATAEGRHTVVHILGPMWGALACVLAMLVAFVLLILAGVRVGTPHGLLLVGLALPGAVVAATGVLLARPGFPRERAARDVLRLYSLVALWLAVGLIADGLVRRLVAFLFGA